MSWKTNAERCKKIIGKPWVIGCFAVITAVVTISVTTGFPFGLSTKQPSITLFVLLIVSLVVLGAPYMMWRKRWFPTIRWWLLNHVLPLVFIFLPPLFGFLALGQTTGGDPGDDAISSFFSPTYYSLMVAVSFTFIVLLADLENQIGASSERDRMHRLHSASAFSLVIALAAALLYALPYVAELGGQLYPQQQRFLFFFSAAAALLAPLMAVFIHARLIGSNGESEADALYS